MQKCSTRRAACYERALQQQFFCQSCRNPEFYATHAHTNILAHPTHEQEVKCKTRNRHPPWLTVNRSQPEFHFANLRVHNFTRALHSLPLTARPSHQPAPRVSTLTLSRIAATRLSASLAPLRFARAFVAPTEGRQQDPSAVGP